MTRILPFGKSHNNLVGHTGWDNPVAIHSALDDEAARPIGATGHVSLIVRQRRCHDSGPTGRYCASAECFRHIDMFPKLGPAWPPSCRGAFLCSTRSRLIQIGAPISGHAISANAR